jgi:cell volume regulation protein A
MRNIVQNYALIAGMLALSWFLSSNFTVAINGAFRGVTELGGTLFVLCGIVIVLLLGFIIYELAKPTALPSFVLAIFFGIGSKDILSIITNNPVTLTTLIVIGAVLILFEGGLETPFRKFKTLIGPILALAIVGTIINAFLFAKILPVLGGAFGVHIPIGAAILLGAAIASTDPAAIIPSLQTLIFKKTRVKHIAISESAINDVVGAVLVGIFLTLFLENGEPSTVIESYKLLISAENFGRIIRTIIIGSGVGFLGFFILHIWNHWKARVQTEDGTDAALFIAIPIFCYMLASLFGGSGFLAVFLCGLLFHMRSHFRHVEHYFNQTIEGFMKPMIFMLLGAMVNVDGLIQYAGIGIAAGLIFMFVLRPLIVFAMLLPFAKTKQRFSMCEMIFLSFVRETGVIPAVLLITIQLSGIPGTEVIMPIGLWVILLTLIIEPPLTPLLACKLGIAKELSSMPQRKHIGPVAVLCSRGYSFPERMDTVVAWADNHHVENIALLHCPEERYSEEFIRDVKKRANALFKSINKTRVNNEIKEINFEFLCGKGLLQDNIEAMVESGDVSIIFVGSKMLDYRMEDVKRLETPFFFMP